MESGLAGLQPQTPPHCKSQTPRGMKQEITGIFEQKENEQMEMKIKKTPLNFEKFETRSSGFSNPQTPKGL
jgi:hypothetical protein